MFYAAPALRENAYTPMLYSCVLVFRKPQSARSPGWPRSPSVPSARAATSPLEETWPPLHVHCPMSRLHFPLCEHSKSSLVPFRVSVTVRFVMRPVRDFLIGILRARAAAAAVSKTPSQRAFGARGARGTRESAFLERDAQHRDVPKLGHRRWHA